MEVPSIGKIWDSDTKGINLMERISGENQFSLFEKLLERGT
jgi:hypothetical protein